MKKRDYSAYTFTGKDLLILVTAGTAVIFLLSFAFFDSAFAAIPLTLLFPLFFRYLKKLRIRQQKMLLRDGFSELLDALLFSCRAGRSMETAFPEAGKILKEALPPGHPLITEWDDITRGLRMSIPACQLLSAFAERTGVEEIEDFASVFAAARQTGGDLAAVIENSASHLTETIRTEKEIEAAVAAKKTESRVMAVMPCFIIFYMRLSSPEYLAPLYHNPAGIFIMTASLILYAVSLFAGERITEITI